MGNSASVSIANITAGVELENIWRKEVIFNARFIDDLIAIADVTEIKEDYDIFIGNMLKHKFLKFSYEFSESQINFLDMTIMLDTSTNIISTTIYKKPMSKHEFVHFDSNHPKHLLKSLPYSCGLRIIRTCSNECTQKSELDILMKKFQNRGYPTSILETTVDKLLKINRNSLLQPKSSLLVNFLTLHNPILLKNVLSHKTKKQYNPHNIYITIPFSNRIRNLRACIVNLFISDMNKCPSKNIKKCIDDLNIKVAFSVPRAIRCYINNA